MIRRQLAYLSSQKLFRSENIQERIDIFRNQRESVEAVELFRYPSWLREVNAKEYEIWTKERNIPDIVKLLHSMAHIEFNAFSSYVDTYYRFKEAVEEHEAKLFMEETTEVALQQAHHFSLLQNRLTALNYPYGQLPVITGLTENIGKSCGNIIERIIVISLVQEGKGLDAIPRLINKVRKTGDKESLEILELIGKEQIQHVAYGVRWLKKLSATPEQTFKNTVRKFDLRIAGVNEAQRRLAQFPLSWLP